MTVGYLASGFDLLNVRDLDLVAQAAEQCPTLVLGVLSDELVEQHYGRRPVVPLVERMALAAHLRGVSRVVEHAEVTLPAELEGEASDLVCFAVTGEPLVLEDRPVEPLTPRRESGSEVLRAALRPVAAPSDHSASVVDEAVA